MNYFEMAPKFRKRKTYAAEWQREVSVLAAMGDYVELDTSLRNYSFGHNQDDYVTIITHLYRLTLADLRYLFALSILENRLKNQEIALAATKHFLGAQLRFYNFERIKIIAIQQNSEGQPMPPMGAAEAGNLVSFVAVFTNRLQFENCAKFVLDQFDAQGVVDVVNPMTQIFMMMLTEKFLGFEPRDWRGEGKSWSVDIFNEEPLFAELWQHWDTEDMALIESLLMQLANRHTFQASRNNKDGSRDFEGHAEQYPIDLHFIMRLREWRGLSNPDIKHRLTEPPFDKLPDPIENIQLPDELRQVVKKMREFIPDFDAVINAAKTRDWQMLL